MNYFRFIPAQLFLLLSICSCSHDDNRAAICAEMLAPLLSETAPSNQTTSILQARTARATFEEASLKLPDDVELRKQFEAVRHEYISTIEATGGLLELNNSLSILGERSQVTNEDIQKAYQIAHEHLATLINDFRTHD